MLTIKVCSQTSFCHCSTGLSSATAEGLCFTDLPLHCEAAACNLFKNDTFLQLLKTGMSQDAEAGTTRAGRLAESGVVWSGGLLWSPGSRAPISNVKLLLAHMMNTLARFDLKWRTWGCVFLSSFSLCFYALKGGTRFAIPYSDNKGLHSGYKPLRYFFCGVPSRALVLGVNSCFVPTSQVKLVTLDLKLTRLLFRVSLSSPSSNRGSSSTLSDLVLQEWVIEIEGTNESCQSHCKLKKETSLPIKPDITHESILCSLW